MTKATKSLSKQIGRLLFYVAIVVGWEAIVRITDTPTYLLPAPSVIGLTIVSDIQGLLLNSLVTLNETVLGFILGATTAIALAIVIVQVSYLRSTLYPLLIALNSFPKVAVAPLFLIWFGLGLFSKVALGAVISFFPVLINMVTGLGEIEPDMLDLVKSMSANTWQTLVKIRLPNSVIPLFDGLKIALPLSMIGAIVGEFIGATSGLGYELTIAQGNLNTSTVFATLVFMVIISLALFYVIVGIESAVVTWRPSKRKR